MKTPQDRIAALEARINTLAVKALSLQLTVSKGDFKESEHPRADDGKFGSGSGSGAGSSPASESKEEQYNRKREEQSKKSPDEKKKDGEAAWKEYTDFIDAEDKKHAEEEKKKITSNWDYTKLSNIEFKKEMKKYLVDMMFPEAHQTTITALKQEFDRRKKAGTWN